MIGSVILALAAWAAIIFLDRELLLLFGAGEETLPLALQYVKPIKFVVPCFLFTQMLAAYLRNDKNPGLATGAVLAGGIFNIFGDYFFVFICDMGAFGAGLATAIGSVISILAMLSHFFTKKNTLSLVRPSGIMKKFREVIVTGFATFFIDIAMGILTILFNRQIMAYLGTNALSVYGVIVNISTFVQCCAYSVGQASQPILSANFGAGKGSRIRETLKYALGTTTFFGIVWVALWHVDSQSVYPHFHGSYRGSAADRALYYTELRNLIFAAAAEYFFNLLFSGCYEAPGSICGIGITRTCYQRNSDPASSGFGRSRRPVVLQCRLQNCLRQFMQL